MVHTNFNFIRTSILIVLYLLCTTSVLAKNKKKIEQADSIHVTKVVLDKSPVVPFHDTIFFVHGNIGSFTPSQRAKALEERIQKLERDFGFNEDSIILVNSQGLHNIMYKGDILLAIDSIQASEDGMLQSEAAAEYSDKIVESIKKQQEETSLQRIALQVLGVLAVIAIEYFIFKFLHHIYRIVRASIRLQRGKRVKGYKNIIDDQRVLQVVLILVRLIRFLIIVVFLYLGLLVLFKIFPYTKHISDQLLGYVTTPLFKMTMKVIGYMPNLFTIIVIVIAFQYLRKFLRSIADKVAEHKIVFKGFYADWAHPTYNIINVILFAFLFIFIYPYLPNSESEIFKGVSVFAGLIISLGSTSVIGNIVAGLVITYMRPFKVGDRIKMGDIVGNVIEKTALVTRVKTTKNELITIPNSNVMNSHTVNYSVSAKDYGLILYMSVPVAYDVPWQKVNDLLMEVAKRTANLSTRQKPFILQDKLGDSCVDYQLNVYIKDANLMAKVYSDLRQNVQDVFNEADIELLAPFYLANIDPMQPNNTPPVAKN